MTEQTGSRVFGKQEEKEPPLKKKSKGTKRKQPSGSSEDESAYSSSSSSPSLNYSSYLPPTDVEKLREDLIEAKVKLGEATGVIKGLKLVIKAKKQTIDFLLKRDEGKEGKK